MSAADTHASPAQAMALRARLVHLVEWIHLELSKKGLDAEATYEQATQLLDVVAEMRLVDPAMLAVPGGIQ
jgi:hypothetical protein